MHPEAKDGGNDLAAGARKGRCCGLRLLRNLRQKSTALQMFPDCDTEEQMTNCIVETIDGRHTVRSVNSLLEIIEEFGERLSRVIWWEDVYVRREWRPKKETALP